MRNDDKDFGGKVIVFGGDFIQILPIVPRTTIYQIISVSLVISYFWLNVKNLLCQGT